MGEKIRILLNRRNMTMQELADRIQISRQNLSNKFSRDNFSEKELREIANKLDAQFIGEFKLNDTKETI
jgi:transcriptional regulator with XRE-family HTH domain